MPRTPSPIASPLRTILVAAACACLAASPAAASRASHGPPSGTPGLGGSPGSAGGVKHHLFDAILRRRDFSVGHAEVTDTPTTTPAGQVEVEVGVGNVAAGEADTLRARSLSVAPLGVTWGVAPRFDLRVNLDTWSNDRVSTTTGTAAEETSGFGDINVRARRCLYGDDSSAVAVGVVLDVRSPHTDPVTGSTRLDGGVIVPAGFDLPLDAHLGVMGEVDARDDVAGTGRHAEYVGSASLTHDVVPTLSVFTEFVSVTSTETGVPWLGVVDGGLYWDAAPVLSVGAGATFGVSDGPNDRGLFAGVSWHRRVR